MTTTTKTTEQIAARLAAALSEHQRATHRKAEDNPLGAAELGALTGGVGVNRPDQRPALSMHTPMAYEMDQAAREGFEQGRADRSLRRKAVARERAARKAAFDELAGAPIVPSSERMSEAWQVVIWLAPIVERIAVGKQQWAARHLGTVAEDIGQVALEQIALVLGKSTQDLDVLERAARELGELAAGNGAIPGHQHQDESAPKERRQVRKARKWLMGLCNNRVMGALVDTYVDQRNLRWDNLDVITTIMASINGPGSDPMFASSKADKAPSMLGTRFTAPGTIDRALLAAAITAAITDRGLDRLTELLLDTDNVRSDGAFRWAELAQDVFLASGDDGQWMWDVVSAHAAPFDHRSRIVANAARAHVRNLFAWLPSFIVEVVASFDPERVEYAVTGARVAKMASTFDGYLPASSGRAPLRPALTFTDAQEAMRALVGEANFLDDFLLALRHA